MSISRPFELSRGKGARNIRGDYPVPTGICLAHNHDNNVFAAIQIIIPSRKQLGAAEALAPSDLIRIRQCGGEAISVLGQEVRVALGDMMLSLVAQLDLVAQILAGKSRH